MFKEEPKKRTKRTKRSPLQVDVFSMTSYNKTAAIIIMCNHMPNFLIIAGSNVKPNIKVYNFNFIGNLF